MTHFEKQIENYINSKIESMNHTIEFAEKQGLDKDYALWSIEGTWNSGGGAVSFTQIYAELIDEETADKLRDRLTEAYFEARNRVRESKVLKWRKEA